MKVSGILSLAALSATALAAPVDEFEVVARGNLPGLDAVQTANANAILGENKKENLGRQGCLAAITTALTEVRICLVRQTALTE